MISGGPPPPPPPSSSWSPSPSPSPSAAKMVVCVGDLFVAPVYVVLTLAALASTAVPILRDVSAHGKTLDERKEKPEDGGVVVDGDDVRDEVGRRRHRDDDRRRRPAVIRLLSSDSLLVNKRRFLHFYVAGVAATLLLFILRRVEDRYYEPVGSTHRFGPQALATFLLLTHLTRRCYECLYVHSWGDGSMHAAGYALGVLHYVVLPFVFLGDGEHAWCCEAESVPPPSPNERDGGGGAGAVPETAPLLGPGVILGAAMVCLGQVEQYRHHLILSELRPSSLRDRTATATTTTDGEKDGDGGGEPKDLGKGSYRIPRGRWFSSVSCPHYLAEILIYVGFAVLLHLHQSGGTGGGGGVKCNLSASVFGRFLWGSDGNGTSHLVLSLAFRTEEYRHVALLVWVVANLSISAMRSHAYYLRRFGGSYPVERKALVPFLW